MLKFNLTVNDQQDEGFKLTVQADSDEAMIIAQELTLQLITKITKIEVKVNSYGE